MISIDDLLLEVRPEFPNTPLDMLRKALRDSLEEFCKYTHVWTMDHQPINIQKGKAVYDLVSPFNKARINAVYSAKYKGYGTQNKYLPLEAQTDRTHDRHYYDPDNFNIRYYETPSRYQIQLIGTPRKDSFEGLKLVVSLFPDSRANEIIEHVFHEYREDIGTGAKYRLYHMPETDWSDTKAALENKELFSERKEKARMDKSRGYIRDNRTALRSRVVY